MSRDLIEKTIYTNKALILRKAIGKLFKKDVVLTLERSKLFNSYWIFCNSNSSTGKLFTTRWGAILHFKHLVKKHKLKESKPPFSKEIQCI